MKHRIALVVVCLFATSANALAQGAGGGTGGGAGGGAGGGGGGGGGGGIGATTGGGAAGPFTGTVQSGFAGGNGTTTSTNAAGGTGGAGGVGGTLAIPTASNPFRATYGNIYAIGQTILGSSGVNVAAANKGFGQPLYTTTTTGIRTTGAGAQGNAPFSFSNTNLSRVPRYASALSNDIPYVVRSPEQLQNELQDVINRSSRLSDSRQIRVVVDGNTVFLVGLAANERDRRTAEGMLRLSPGVNAIENRLALPDQP